MSRVSAIATNLKSGFQTCLKELPFMSGIDQTMILMQQNGITQRSVVTLTPQGPGKFKFDLSKEAVKETAARIACLILLSYCIRPFIYYNVAAGSIHLLVGMAAYAKAGLPGNNAADKEYAAAEFKKGIIHIATAVYDFACGQLFSFSRISIGAFGIFYQPTEKKCHCIFEKSVQFRSAGDKSPVSSSEGFVDVSAHTIPALSSSVSSSTSSTNSNTSSMSTEGTGVEGFSSPERPARVEGTQEGKTNGVATPSATPGRSTDSDSDTEELAQGAVTKIYDNNNLSSNCYIEKIAERISQRLVGNKPVGSQPSVAPAISSSTTSTS